MTTRPLGLRRYILTESPPPTRPIWRTTVINAGVILSVIAGGLGLLIGALQISSRPTPTLADWLLIVGHNPTDAAAHRALAAAYSAQQQDRLAYPHWLIAAAAWPHDQEAQHAVAAGARALGQTQVALEAWQAILVTNPSDTLTAHQLGDLLAAQGDRAGALVVWEAAAVHAGPSDRASAYSKLIAPYLATGRAADAVQAAQQALTADPHRLDAWCGLGDAAALAGDVVNERRAYQACRSEAVHSSDTVAPTWAGYARTHLEQLGATQP